jgi:Asp-tRNA(Asn)/Glu-tRNA(Gln) amidotransferase C subunit
MDFILMACLVGFSLLLLTISYDIACQWAVNLAARNKKLPKEMQLDLEKICVRCGLPVWHAGSHEDECQNANSLSFMEGVGKSDGEGVERTWAVLNPSAYHTKDAGQGVREDVLEDKIDNHNFLKNLGQGESDLLSWMVPR